MIFVDNNCRFNSQLELISSLIPKSCAAYGSIERVSVIEFGSVKIHQTLPSPSFYAATQRAKTFRFVRNVMHRQRMSF